MSGYPHVAGGISRGLLANRPPAAGRSGQGYVATDVLGGLQYVSDGTNWQADAPSEATTLTAGVTFNGTGQAGGTDVTLWAPWTIPAGFLVVGQELILELGLDCDLINSVTGRNLVFKLKLGATTVWTGTMSVPASVAATDQAALVRLLLTCYAVGAGGGVRSQASLDGAMWATAAFRAMAGGSTPHANVAVDTTVAQAITVTVNESVNSVADLVRSDNGAVWLAAA